jgi:hypothetical protein
MRQYRNQIEIEDRRAALIAWMLYSVNRTKGSAKKKVDDFLLHTSPTTPKKKIQTQDEQINFFRTLTRSMEKAQTDG